jgi:hypothetical protein
MKLDPTKPILDLDDMQIIEDVAEPIFENGRQVFDPTGQPAMHLTGEKRPVTFALLAERVLGNRKQGMANDEQYRRFRIALTMRRAKGPVEITAEDAALLKSAMGEAGFSPLIYGRAEDIIEGRDAPALEPTVKSVSEAA